MMDKGKYTKETGKRVSEKTVQSTMDRRYGKKEQGTEDKANKPRKQDKRTRENGPGTRVKK